MGISTDGVGFFSDEGAPPPPPPPPVAAPPRIVEIMATTGDADDMMRRLKSLLPYRWWAYIAPIRDAVLGGVVAALVWVYSFYDYVKRQTRILTATEFNLDLIAWDFFGGKFKRKPGQNDAFFRIAIIQEILRPRATRPGMTIALTNLTGVAPIIFEPSNPNDTGVYGRGMGYSVAGRYGSLEHPYEAWIDVQRPLGQGIPGVEGYGGLAGGYDAGRSEFVSLDMVTGPVTDLDIYETVENTRPAGTICWVRISDLIPPADLSPSYSFLLSPEGDRLVLDDHGGIIIDGPPTI